MKDQNINSLFTRPVGEVMTRFVRHVRPNTVLTDIEPLFKIYRFHHLPVLDEDETPIGMISKHDLYQVQHHFTRLQVGNYEEQNKKVLGALLASDIMSKEPICLRKTDNILDAVNIFLENIVHAIIVCDDGACVGIITPQDILRSFKDTMDQSP